MSDFVFCSYADSNYADRLLALILSIQKHHHGARIFVLALDHEVKGMICSAIPDVSIDWLEVSDLDVLYAEMGVARKQRHKWDGNLTARCFFVREVVKSTSPESVVVCLDSDTFLFSNLNSFKKEFINHSIGITPHRFSAKLKDSERYGKFNAGVLFFKNSNEAVSCLDQWCHECLLSCSSELTETTYADQKYLDNWPEKQKRILIIQSYGINAAPWNLDATLVTQQNKDVYLNDDLLMIYHFHGFREITPGYFYHGLSMYKTALNSIIRESVYMDYIDSLSKARELLGLISTITLLPLEGGVGVQKMVYDSAVWALNQIITLLDASNDELSLSNDSTNYHQLKSCLTEQQSYIKTLEGICEERLKTIIELDKRKTDLEMVLSEFEEHPFKNAIRKAFFKAR